MNCEYQSKVKSSNVSSIEQHGEISLHYWMILRISAVVSDLFEKINSGSLMISFNIKIHTESIKKCTTSINLMNDHIL